MQQRQSGSHFKTTERIVALGASTGGTEAIKEVLMQLPAWAPGMVITQHIPAAFSGPFARRMDTVREELKHQPDGQISLTDSDSRSMISQAKGSGRVGYNVQAVVDARHHLIVGP